MYSCSAAAVLVHALDERGIAWRPLGSGSNVLADDGEHHYVIVSLKELKANPVFDGNQISLGHYPPAPANDLFPHKCSAHGIIARIARRWTVRMLL